MVWRLGPRDLWVCSVGLQVLLVKELNVWDPSHQRLRASELHCFEVSGDGASSLGTQDPLLRALPGL